MGTPATLTPALMPPQALARFVAAFASGVQDKPGFFRSARGRIGVRVVDGPSLTIHFGDLRSPVTAGIERVDLTLELTDGHLGQLMDGTLDAVSALTSGSLKLSGDLMLLKTLEQLLARGQSALSLRASR